MRRLYIVKADDKKKTFLSGNRQERTGYGDEPGRSDVSHDEPVAHGLDGTVHGHDSSSALRTHVQIVSDGAGRHLQNLR